VSDFDPPLAIVTAVVRNALDEDLGIMGDITSLAAVAEDSFSVGRFVARDEGVLAGCLCVDEVFAQIDPNVVVAWAATDAASIESGQVLATIEGRTRSILAGERVALNLLCLLSGVATSTRRYVRATHGQARILDTRKTLPGLRGLQKAAVRAGGGFNHRDSLSGAVLLKDNHLAVVGVTSAVERARVRWPGRMIEVECESTDQVAAALAAGADRIMLDNMTPDEVRRAVKLIEGRVPVEVSGRVTVEDVGQYAAAGADFISIGAITHSVRVFDIGLDLD
jgi:nicotinate-nucleotide pyrophosphorylase (carboxylating)